MLVEVAVGRVVQRRAHHGFRKLSHAQTVLRVQPDTEHSYSTDSGIRRLSVHLQRHSPLLQEGAAGVFDVLQLEEAGADQESLNVLLVDGDVAAVREVDESLQSAAAQTLVILDPLALNISYLPPGLPGVHALHEDLVLLTLHHVVGEHGVEVRDGGRQDDAMGAELMIAHLQVEPQVRSQQR